MSRLASLVTALLASLALAGALAQAAFTGSYTAQGQNGTITLSLQQSGNNVSGTLAAGNASFRMAGQVQPDGTVLGLADSGQGQVYFLAQVQGNNLELILAEIDPRTNGVVPGSERSIVFARSGGAPPAAGASGGLPGVGQAPAAQAAPFAGTFQNPDMTLALQASGNAYGGTLTAGSSRYEVQAQGSGSSLNGSLVAGGTTYLFVATLSGNTLSLQVNGVTYQLTRAAPAAPAQGGALPGLPGGVTLPGNTSAGVGAAAPTAAAAPATGFPANALEAQANQVYSTGTYVKSTQHGVAVRVPAGFQGGAFNGGLLLGKGNELNLLMIPVVGAAVGELTATLSQPLHLAEGLEFQPAARPTVRGNAVTVPMRSGQLTATAYGLAGPDVGVFLMVLGTAGTENAQAAALQEFADSVRFAAPGYLPTLRQFQSSLTGKQLYRFTFSGSSTSSVTRTAAWDLCADGSYYYEGNAETSHTLRGSGGYDGSAFVTPPQTWGSVFGQHQSGSSGWWRLVVLGTDVTLLLVRADGTIESHTLQPDGQYVRMNGGKDQLTVSASRKCR